MRTNHKWLLALILVLCSAPVWAAGIFYSGDSLPTASGWSVFGTSSTQNGTSLTSTIITDTDGSVAWRLYDNSTTLRCMERYTSIGSLSFDTGATIAARVRVSGLSGTTAHNLGISNNGTGGMFLKITATTVSMVDTNAVTRGNIYSLTGTAYHNYQLTVKNATLGNNATAVWRMYVDGVERATWTGAGSQDGYDGFMAGHAGGAGRGYWYFDSIAMRCDGAYSPSQWDPTGTTVPAAPTVTLPASGSNVTVRTPTIHWTGIPHDHYEVHVCTTNSPTTNIVWDSNSVASTNNSCDSGNLANGTYYAFVRLYNAAGWGSWSAGQIFNIVSSTLPAPPSIVMPANGTYVMTQTPKIQWIGDSHDAYEVHINSINSPSSGIVWNSGQLVSTNDTYTTREITTLPNGAYYAFVRLHNSAGWGNWCSGQSFTVDAPSETLKKGWVLLRDDDHTELLSKAREYHVNHIQISHDMMMNAWEPLRDTARRDYIRNTIDIAKANGVEEVVLWTHEVQFDDLWPDLLVGGKVNMDSPRFWQWLDQEYESLYYAIPNADGLVLTLTENELQPGIGGADVINRDETIHTGKTPAESVQMLIEGIWAVCQRHGWSLYVRNWAGGGSDRWVRDAVRASHPDIWLMSKATGAGDWNMIQEDYDQIGTCTGHREMVEFDILGEYWGYTQTPWAGIDFLRHLWTDFSLTKNNVNAMVARVDRGNDYSKAPGIEPRAYDGPNRINFYALDAFSDCPEITSDAVYDYWSNHWFGPVAAPKVASAMKRAFGISNACWNIPTPYGGSYDYSFSDFIAVDYCYKSLFDIDCVSKELKLMSNFNPTTGLTNYEVLRNPFERAAGMLGVIAEPTLFGDFSPSRSSQSNPTCTVTVVDAANGLNPGGFSVQYSTNGGSTWINHANFSVAQPGSATEPFVITAASVPFGSPKAALNRIMFTATNNASQVTSRIFTVSGLEVAYIDLGTLAADGISHPQTGEGSTTGTSAGGKTCRKPLTSSDKYFYFDVDNAFAFDRSPQTLYLQVEYYGSAGYIKPIYDGAERSDEMMTPVYLAQGGVNSWRKASWRLDNINFGNKVIGLYGADFKLLVSDPSTCIKDIRLFYTEQSGMLYPPLNLQAAALSTSEVRLDWEPTVGATKYQVCRGEAFVGWSTGTSFVDSGLSPNTEYIYTVTAADASGRSSGSSLYKHIVTLSIPPVLSELSFSMPIESWRIGNWINVVSSTAFGTGSREYYQYVIDKSLTHTWTGNEETWPLTDPPTGNGWKSWRPSAEHFPIETDPMWLMYDGSPAQRLMNEEIVDGAWKFSDQGRVSNTKVKITSWPDEMINRSTGVTVMARIKTADSPLGWDRSGVNFGLNMYDCPEVGAIIRPDYLQLQGTSSSSSVITPDNGYSYHTYTMTLKTENVGGTMTPVMKLYRDGKYMLSMNQNPEYSIMWSGPMFGQTVSNAVGTWYFEWLAWNTGGAYVHDTSQVMLTVPNGGAYYIHLRSCNAEGVPNGTLDYGPFYLWNGVHPVAPAVTDDGEYTTRDGIHAKWTLAAPSPDYYEYAVGSTPGAQDILPYTSSALTREMTQTGLSMTVGQKYYVSVRGVKSITGPVGSSDGIEVAPGYDAINEAKALTDGSPVALYGKAVTAVFPDCAYVQEPFIAGLRVVTSRPIAPEQEVELAGVITGSGSERTIQADTVIATGTAGPVKPLAMKNKTLGGTQLAPSTMQIEPRYDGLNNMSMLVRVWGLVKTVDDVGHTFTIDDGSGAPVKCIAPATVDLPEPNNYISVNGIVSCEPSGLYFQRLLLIRQGEDISYF